MTVGPRWVLDLVAGVSSVIEKRRGEWADVAGGEFDDYGGLDDEERRAVAPAHLWCMCLEPSIPVRERFLNSIDALSVRGSVSPTMVAEVQEWLAMTGTDPRTEIDYVETFTEIVEANGATPQIPLTPERVAPFVDVLRGITSASAEERTRAAKIVPDLLTDLRPEEQWGFTGVLVRAAIVEEEHAVRDGQLRALRRAHRAGTIHENDGRLLAETFSDAATGTIERRVVDDLRRR